MDSRKNSGSDKNNIMHIYDADASYVYAYQDMETGTLCIGFKSPLGDDKFTYITSCKDGAFWDRYSRGRLERSILFIGPELKARAAEWFAWDYGKKLGRKFFNAVNNAHRIDESILTTHEKQVIIDFLRGDGKGIPQGSVDVTEANENHAIVATIAKHIEERTNFYKEVDVSIHEVCAYGQCQVREVVLNHHTVTKIRQRLLENPKEARETFKPIVVLVSKDDVKRVISGHTRREAARKTAGWNSVPVVYLNESEFGSTEEIREQNILRFGLYMNREPFEVRATNSKEDLKRNINNFLAAQKLDLSKPAHKDRARQLVYLNFDYVCGSKQQLNGLLESIVTDFEKTQAELTYQAPLTTYDDAYFADYKWNKYGVRNISTVVSKVGECANAKPLAFVLRVMRKEKNMQGAIILHYTTKRELVEEKTGKWIDDLIETIRYMKLKIEVDLLPYDGPRPPKGGPFKLSVNR